MNAENSERQCCAIGYGWLWFVQVAHFVEICQLDQFLVIRVLKN